MEEVCVVEGVEVADGLGGGHLGGEGLEEVRLKVVKCGGGGGGTV